MAAQYLLPCECGKTIEIETSQAGQQIDCPHCGASVLAPTLRGIRQLEPVESEPATARSSPSWSRSKGVLFATGVGLLFVSLAVSAVLLYHRGKLETAKPEIGPPPYLYSDQQIDNLAPHQVAYVWRTQIENSSLDEWQPKEFVFEREEERMINVMLTVLAGVAILGVALAVGTVVAKRKPAPSSNSVKA